MFDIVLAVLAAIGLITIIFSVIEAVVWVDGVNRDRARAGRDHEYLKERMFEPYDNHSDLEDEFEDLKQKVLLLGEKKSGRN